MFQWRQDETMNNGDMSESDNKFPVPDFFINPQGDTYNKNTNNSTKLIVNCRDTWIEEVESSNRGDLLDPPWGGCYSTRKY